MWNLFYILFASLLLGKDDLKCPDKQKMIFFAACPLALGILLFMTGIEVISSIGAFIIAMWILALIIYCILSVFG